MSTDDFRRENPDGMVKERFREWNFVYLKAGG